MIIVMADSEIRQLPRAQTLPAPTTSTIDRSDTAAALVGSKRMKKKRVSSKLWKNLFVFQKNGFIHPPPNSQGPKVSCHAAFGSTGQEKPQHTVQPALISRPSTTSAARASHTSVD